MDSVTSGPYLWSTLFDILTPLDENDAMATMMRKHVKHGDVEGCMTSNNNNDADEWGNDVLEESLNIQSSKHFGWSELAAGSGPVQDIDGTIVCFLRFYNESRIKDNLPPYNLARVIDGDELQSITKCSLERNEDRKSSYDPLYVHENHSFQSRKNPTNYFTLDSPHFDIPKNILGRYVMLYCADVSSVSSSATQSSSKIIINKNHSPIPVVFIKRNIQLDNIQSGFRDDRTILPIDTNRSSHIDDMNIHNNTFLSRDEIQSRIKLDYMKGVGVPAQTTSSDGNNSSKNSRKGHLNGTHSGRDSFPDISECPYPILPHISKFQYMHCQSLRDYGYQLLIGLQSILPCPHCRPHYAPMSKLWIGNPQKFEEIAGSMPTLFDEYDGSENADGSETFSFSKFLWTVKSLVNTRSNAKNAKKRVVDMRRIVFGDSGSADHIWILLILLSMNIYDESVAEKTDAERDVERDFLSRMNNTVGGDTKKKNEEEEEVLGTLDRNRIMMDSSELTAAMKRKYSVLRTGTDLKSAFGGNEELAKEWFFNVALSSNNCYLQPQSSSPIKKIYNHPFLNHLHNQEKIVVKVDESGGGGGGGGGCGKRAADLLDIMKTRVSSNSFSSILNPPSDNTYAQKPILYTMSLSRGDAERMSRSDMIARLENNILQRQQSLDEAYDDLKNKSDEYDSESILESIEDQKKNIDSAKNQLMCRYLMAEAITSEKAYHLDDLFGWIGEETFGMRRRSFLNILESFAFLCLGKSDEPHHSIFKFLFPVPCWAMEGSSTSMTTWLMIQHWKWSMRHQMSSSSLSPSVDACNSRNGFGEPFWMPSMDTYDKVGILGRFPLWLKYSLHQKSNYTNAMKLGIIQSGLSTIKSNDDDRLINDYTNGFKVSISGGNDDGGVDMSSNNGANMIKSIMTLCSEYYRMVRNNSGGGIVKNNNAQHSTTTTTTAPISEQKSSSQQSTSWSMRNLSSTKASSVVEEQQLPAEQQRRNSNADHAPSMKMFFDADLTIQQAEWMWKYINLCWKIYPFMLGDGAQLDG